MWATSGSTIFGLSASSQQNLAVRILTAIQGLAVAHQKIVVGHRGIMRSCAT